MEKTEDKDENSSHTKPTRQDETRSPPFDLDKGEERQEPRHNDEGRRLASTGTAKPTGAQRESRKTIFSILRLRGSTRTSRPQQIKWRRRSTSSHPGPSKEGQRYPRNVSRTASYYDTLAQGNSQQRISRSRSSSEYQYGSSSRRTSQGSPRHGSRRWQGDDFTVRSADQEEEELGELDSFFRFIEDCSKAVWIFLKRIPVVVSQFPEITMNVLKQLIPMLRGPTTPLIEGPQD